MAEVPYLHIHDGLLYHRPALDPYDELVDVPVMPAPLRRGALMAMHHDPLLCHPAAQALFALARKRFYWPGMRQDCTKVVSKCGVCDRAKATLRKGAGRKGSQNRLLRRPSGMSTARPSRISTAPNTSPGLRRPRLRTSSR